jgi:hypothetical protein
MLFPCRDPATTLPFSDSAKRGRVAHMRAFVRARARARTHAHDDVKHEVQTWLRGQDPTFYRQGFKKRISRLDKCINREGDYVEK